jgi:hypothetical protein
MRGTALMLQRRRLLVIVGGCLVLGVVVVPLAGLTGAWDNYFTVKIQNATSGPISVQMCDTSSCKSYPGGAATVQAGANEPESGSSTVDSWFQVRDPRGRSSPTCFDLSFRRKPRQPVVIRVVGKSLRASIPGTCR